MYGATNTLINLENTANRAFADLTAAAKPGTGSGAGLVIDIINPSKEAFDDFGIVIDGQLQIPFVHLNHASTVIGSTSGVHIQDANLLKIKVTYGYPMFIPIVNELAANVLALIDPKNIKYYSADPPRLPIESTALLRMQSEAYPDNNWSLVERAILHLKKKTQIFTL